MVSRDSHGTTLIVHGAGPWKLPSWSLGIIVDDRGKNMEVLPTENLKYMIILYDDNDDMIHNMMDTHIIIIYDDFIWWFLSGVWTWEKGHNAWGCELAGQKMELGRCHWDPLDVFFLEWIFAIQKYWRPLRPVFHKLLRLFLFFFGIWITWRVLLKGLRYLFDVVCTLLVDTGNGRNVWNVYGSLMEREQLIMSNL